MSHGIRNSFRASRSQAQRSRQSTSRKSVASMVSASSPAWRPILLQLGEQLLESLPLAERVKSTLGAKMVDVVEAGRRTFSAGPSPGRRGLFLRRPTRPCPLVRRDPRARHGAGDGESLLAFCSRSPSGSLSACRTSAAAPAGSPRARRARPRPTSDRPRLVG